MTIIVACYFRIFGTISVAGWLWNGVSATSNHVVLIRILEHRKTVHNRLLEDEK